MTHRKIAYWVIPPQADAECVASMENVLDTYAKPYDPQLPVVCMDEQPMQWLKETRAPMPATKKHAKRIDDEYERPGQPRSSCVRSRYRVGAACVCCRSGPRLTGLAKSLGC